MHGHRILQNSAVLLGGDNKVQKHLGFLLQCFKWLERADLCLFGERQSDLQHLVQVFKHPSVRKDEATVKVTTANTSQSKDRSGGSIGWRQ
jgi:hypothetical protein